MNREKIRANYLNRMNFFERKYSSVMAKAILTQYRLVVSTLKTSGVQAAMRVNDSVLMNEQVSTVVRDMYKTIGLYYANESYRNIQEQVKSKGFGFNEEWIAEILNYFRLYLLSKAVVPITETTKELIRNILIEGEQNGWGIDKMVYQLEQTDITIARARLIVRTESAKAAFKGRDLAHKQSPYKLSLEWIAAKDHRTRHSHRNIDGVKIEEGNRFPVPVFDKKGKIDVQIGVDYMLGPGDPKAHKQNVINCRCTTSERVIFKNDEPVMKRVAV